MGLPPFSTVSMALLFACSKTFVHASTTGVINSPAASLATLPLIFHWLPKSWFIVCIVSSL